MSRATKRLRQAARLAGNFCCRPGDVLRFLRSYREWQRHAPAEWRADFAEVKACFRDRHDAAGSAQGHYFLQDLWAAQRVHAFAPAEHVDVGSRVDGFVAHVASFCPVTYLDIRPLATSVPNLTCKRGSVCELPFGDRLVASLSCLHVLEHIGLGRYGDPLDPAGWQVGLRELQRVLAPGGQLLVGVPCGRSRVAFHAHRVFAPEQIFAALPELRLREFSLVCDGRSTSWLENASLAAAENLAFGCGLFRFSRPQ